MFVSSSHHSSTYSAGYLLVLVLVLGAVFFTITTAFIGYIVTQSQAVKQQVSLEKASEIAEAGLNYYRWYLAHYPDDVTNGTGVPGPYVHTYADPEDGVIGEFSLNIASSTYCGDVSAIDVSSTGTTYDDDSVSRTINARYSRPTVAEYAFIINSNVWAGADRVIIGPYHSNQGVRMDGTNQSTVTSGVEDWSCTSSFGCSPSQTVDGVFTTTSNANPLLFSFPSAPINFASLTIDMANMQDRAENAGGIYLPPSTRAGYRISFQGDGTFNLYEIRQKENEPQGNAYGFHLNKIKNAQFEGNFPIPTDCPLIFVEDDLWIDGVLDSKVTIAAADLDTAGEDPTIILNDNLTYNSEDAGLLAAAEFDVLIGFDVPDDMEVNGIFIAQNGKFGRNYYDESWVPSAWDEYVRRNSLTINGTIVSNGRVGTKWICGGVYCSGFEYRYNSYDRNLVNDPPPLAPATSDVYEFTEWREAD